MPEAHPKALPDIERLTSGVDWVTYTAPHGDGGEQLLATGWRIVQEEAAAGSKRQAFGAHGYRGEQTAHAAVGERDDGVYLRLSGETAWSRWGEIGSFGGKPTRLDLQTTCLFSWPSTRFGQLTLRRTRSTLCPAGRTPRSSLTRASDGEWTGRVGSRASRQYIRVYDKGVEQQRNPPGREWRIEVELKREYAETTWHRLREAGDAARFCYAYLESSIRRAGFSWRLPPSGSRVELGSVESGERPDVEASLRWLRQQVRPTVERLRAAGLTIQVLTALSFLDLRSLGAQLTGESDEYAATVPEGLALSDLSSRVGGEYPRNDREPIRLPVE